MPTEPANTEPRNPAADIADNRRDWRVAALMSAAILIALAFGTAVVLINTALPAPLPTEITQGSIASSVMMAGGAGYSLFTRVRRIRARRIRENACSRCGYELIPQCRNRCPECGLESPIAERRIPALRGSLEFSADAILATFGVVAIYQGVVSMRMPDTSILYTIAMFAAGVVLVGLFVWRRRANLKTSRSK